MTEVRKTIISLEAVKRNKKKSKVIPSQARCGPEGG